MGDLKGIYVPDGDPASVQHGRCLRCAAADRQHTDQNGILTISLPILCPAAVSLVSYIVGKVWGEEMGVFDLKLMLAL